MSHRGTAWDSVSRSDDADGGDKWDVWDKSDTWDSWDTWDREGDQREARSLNMKTANVFILDYLRHGPARLEDLVRDAWVHFRITREQIALSAGSLGLLTGPCRIKRHCTAWVPTGSSGP